MKKKRCRYGTFWLNMAQRILKIEGNIWYEGGLRNLSKQLFPAPKFFPSGICNPVRHSGEAQPQVCACNAVAAARLVPGLRASTAPRHNPSWDSRDATRWHGPGVHCRGQTTALPLEVASKGGAVRLSAFGHPNFSGAGGWLTPFDPPRNHFHRGEALGEHTLSHIQAITDGGWRVTNGGSICFGRPLTTLLSG